MHHFESLKLRLKFEVAWKNRESQLSVHFKIKTYPLDGNGFSGVYIYTQKTNHFLPKETKTLLPNQNTL